MQHSFSSQPDRLPQQVLQTVLTPYLKEAPLTTVLMRHRQRFSFSCSAHYFLLHHPFEHLLRAFCVMMEKKKKSKVPRLCFLILHWEGLALRKHLITKIFSSEEKQPHNLKKKNNCRYFLEQSHKITVTSILLGTWAYKTSATLSNGVRKIPDSWTKAATLFTCQLLWAINWQVWSLGLTFSANSTMLVGQIAASISDFLRVLTQLLNFIIASYHQQIKRQQIIGYRLPVLHSFPLPLEIELLWCNLGQVIPYIHLKIIQGSSH